MLSEATLTMVTRDNDCKMAEKGGRVRVATLDADQHRTVCTDGCEDSVEIASKHRKFSFT